MQVSPLPEYREEIVPVQLRPDEYLATAKQAAARLKWHIAFAKDNTIICHTQGRNSAFGESVTITMANRKIIFHSVAVNEYYWTDGQNEQNAARFKRAMADITVKAIKKERNQAPAARAEFGALIPSKIYKITPALVYLNIFIFLCMFFSGVSLTKPETQDLFEWGGNFRQAVVAGEWWRLFTYMFLHAGAMHLLMNMYALLYIGMYLEPLMGRLRFASAYVLTGICAGLLSVAMHDHSVGVGASGAIFGMYGIFLSMLTTSHIEKTTRKTMLRSILFFVVFNLIMGLQGNTDNAAHIGGLLSGIIIGYIYYPGIAKPQSMRLQAGITALLTASIVALSIITIHTWIK